MPRAFPHTVDYAYLADLCRVNDWALALHRYEWDDDRFALRVFGSRPIDPDTFLAGCTFTGQANLDAVAEVVFDLLDERGHV